MPQAMRRLEWGAAIALCLFLAAAEAFFALGLFDLPLDGILDLEPNTTFAEVRPVAGWPLRVALLVSAIAAGLAVPLTALRSAWAFALIVLHFVTAKIAWVLSAFLPNYDGGPIGAWMTVIQILAIALVFRAASPFHFAGRTA